MAYRERDAKIVAARDPAPAGHPIRFDPTVKKTSFATPQDCEAAFYDALERADFEAMMAVWSEDDEIVCVHPGGPRIVGYAAVRASWAIIMQSGERLSVKITDVVQSQSGMMAMHSLFENIAPAGSPRERESVVATNIFARTASGWRMVAHHASAAPRQSAPVLTSVRSESVVEAPKILH